jgi:nucleoside-diphosphate-sugar epimerase
MKILLTGASGFIGRYASAALKGRCRYVVRKTDKDSFEDRFIVDNIDENTNWEGAFQNCSSIIHLAGLAHSNTYTLNDYINVNVNGTLKLASEAAKVGLKRFVFVSSIVVNGNNTKQLPFSSGSDANPVNAYAKSKYMAEVGLKEISESMGLEVVIIRPTLVYGLNAPGNFGMLSKLVYNLPILPFGITNNKRDFIAVQNLVDLLIICAQHKNASGHIFLASDSETVSIKEFTNAIGEGLGKSITQIPVPISLMRLCVRLFGRPAMAEQLFGNLQVDSSNIQEILGWVPPYTMKQAMASLSEIKYD